MIKNFLNPEGHQNRINGSKVMAILLKGWISPIGGASTVEGYEIDYVIVIQNFLNPEGHQNPIGGSKVSAILLKGWIWPIGGASVGEGLRLQPAQQACLIVILYWTVLNGNWQDKRLKF